MKCRSALALVLLALLAACAGPPLTLYTLSLPASSGPDIPLRTQAPVIYVARMALPVDVDGTDLLLRDGSILRRSLSGRWASRLSVGMTNRLIERLGARYPGALVTDTPSADTAAASIRINISRLDVDIDGSAVMDANWAVIPANTRLPVRQQRTRITLQGQASSDADIVALIGALVDRLAAEINPGELH